MEKEQPSLVGIITSSGLQNPPRGEKPNSTNCPPIENTKIKKKPMSASFAYALEQMREKYIEIQFIEIEDEEGTLPEHELKRLIASRANCIIHDEKIYKLTTVEKPIYHYINITTTKVDPIIAITTEYLVNVNTGRYSYREIITGGPEDIERLQREIDATNIRVDNVQNNINIIYDNAITATAIEHSPEDQGFELQLEYIQHDEDEN